MTGIGRLVMVVTGQHRLVMVVTGDGGDGDGTASHEIVNDANRDS